MEFLPDSHPLLVYLGVFISPIFQEDTAVLIAATLAAASANKWMVYYIVILCGLFLSDIWKYWIGWFALKHPKARAYAGKEHVETMGDKVQNNLLKTLLFGRFVPLVRIPTYIACGYFKISYAKFCLLVAFTGWLYVSIVFTAVRILGEIVGEKLLWIMPLFALTVVASIAAGHFIKKRRLAKTETN